MKADNFDTPTNPYHYVLHCIGGKWKMTILHEIYTYGSIRFNQTLKILPISGKRCSASSSRSWWRRGLIRRISYDTVPPKVEYVLTPSGEQLIPAWTYSISGVSARCTTAESPSMRMPL